MGSQRSQQDMCVCAQMCITNSVKTFLSGSAPCVRKPLCVCLLQNEIIAQCKTGQIESISCVCSRQNPF